MPVLSIYFGTSEISLLAVNTPVDYRLFNYPYFIKDESFVREVIKLASKELGFKTAGVPIVCSGFPSVYGADFLGAAASATLDMLLPKYTGLTPVFVSPSTVISSGGFYSTLNPSFINDDNLSPYYDMSLYPHIVHVDNLDQLNADHVIRFFSKDLIVSDGSVPVVFTGDRFSTSYKDNTTSFMLLFDLLKSPGVYDIKLDTRNALPNLAMLNAYSPEYSSLVQEYKYDSLGTLVNSPGSVECLVENEDGTSQIIEVAQDSIFTIPMLESSLVRILLKGPGIGSVEKKVRGGRLGLVIDTRIKSDPKTFNIDYFENGYKMWEERVKEALCTYL